MGAKCPKSLLFIYISLNYILNTNYKSYSETGRIRVRILAEHILKELFQYFTSVNEVLAT